MQFWSCEYYCVDGKVDTPHDSGDRRKNLTLFCLFSKKILVSCYEWIVNACLFLGRSLIYLTRWYVEIPLPTHQLALRPAVCTAQTPKPLSSKSDNDNRSTKQHLQSSLHLCNEYPTNDRGRRQDCYFLWHQHHEHNWYHYNSQRKGGNSVLQRGH